MITNKDLVELLVEVHHRYFRDSFGRLYESVVELPAFNREDAKALVPEMAAAATALEAHFREEEENLFPKILRAEEVRAASAEGREAAEYYEVTVRDLISEHEETKSFLEKFVKWSKTFNQSNPTEYGELADRFLAAAVLLNAHILLEEELLFPRAEALFRI